MCYIEKIAYHVGERSEVPNQELATLLAQEKKVDGIAEIASYLSDKNKSIASDCLKVLYEIGYIEPMLIEPHIKTFLSLLDSKNNRMVWGAMIALSTIAKVSPKEIYVYTPRILELIETGTVITNVSGVRTLVHLASHGEPYYSALKDELFRLQSECRPVDFTKRAEEMYLVIVKDDLPRYLDILNSNLPNISNAAQKRLQRVINKINKLLQNN